MVKKKQFARAKLKPQQSITLFLQSADWPINGLKLCKPIGMLRLDGPICVITGLALTPSQEQKLFNKVSIQKITTTRTFKNQELFFTSPIVHPVFATALLCCQDQLQVYLTHNISKCSLKHLEIKMLLIVSRIYKITKITHTDDQLQ